MTNEEAIKEAGIMDYDFPDGLKERVLIAMNQARKDESVAFAESVSKSFWHYNINTLSWYNIQLGHRRVLSSELYTIFKQQNS